MVEQSAIANEPRNRRGHTFRTSVWFGALLVFAFATWLGDYASDKTGEFETEDKWRALSRELIVEEQAGNAVGQKCSAYAECLSQFEERLRVMDEPPKTLEVQLLSGLYLALKIIGLIGEVLAGAVLIEGALRLAVLVGRHLHILDDDWKSFTDEFLKKIPELVKNTSSATMAVPMLAALTAGGVATAYYAAPAPHKAMVDRPAAAAGKKDTEQGDLEKNLEKLANIVSAANAGMASAVRETASAVKATARTVSATAGTVQKTAYAVGDHAASAVRAASRAADSAETLKASILALNMAQQSGADGFRHSESFFTPGRCEELKAARDQGGNDLANFFNRIGWRTPAQSQPNDLANQLISAFCTDTPPPVSKVAAP